MSKDLKNILSQDVYKAYENIRGLAKELGGGRSKKEIDSVTEYKQLQALLNGQGQVAKNKMTKTDVAELSTLLANAVKWKPIGDDFESSAKPTEKEVKQAEKAENEAKNLSKAEEPNVQQEEKPVKDAQKDKSEPKKKSAPSRKQGPVVNNTSTTNNSGINHSFNGNKGTIVIDNSVHIGTEKADQAKPDGPVTPTPDNKDKDDINRKNKENYEAAFKEGAQVAKDLIGYTTQDEKARAIRTIMKQDENTIIGFMKGYYSEDSVMGIGYGVGDLLDQVDNEYGWTDSEKRRVFTNIMEATLKYAEKTGNTENTNYKELAKLLQDVKAGREINTETADAYIKELISAGAVDVEA